MPPGDQAYEAIRARSCISKHISSCASRRNECYASKDTGLASRPKTVSICLVADPTRRTVKRCDAHALGFQLVLNVFLIPLSALCG
jgi:hypothetical protein